MVVNKNLLRWAGGSLVLVNLVMFLCLGMGYVVFAGSWLRWRVVCCRVVG